MKSDNAANARSTIFSSLRRRFRHRRDYSSDHFQLSSSGRLNRTGVTNDFLVLFGSHVFCLYSRSGVAQRKNKRRKIRTNYIELQIDDLSHVVKLVEKIRYRTEKRGKQKR